MQDFLSQRQPGPPIQVQYNIVTGSNNTITNHTQFKLINSGFHPKNAIFTSPFNDFEGRVVNVVLPNVTTFSLTFPYPDGSKVRSGPDYLAAYYISAALNFELR